MLIGIPTPGEVVGMAKATVGWAVNSAATVGTIPGRVIGLVDGSETLLSRVHETLDRVEELVERTARTVEEAEEVLGRSRTAVTSAAEVVEDAVRVSSSVDTVVEEATRISERASSTIAQAGRAADTVENLLSAYESTARRAAPMVERFVSELSSQEVDAAIRLVDELPVLTEHVLTDILPILRTLDRVGPEIHELLEVTHDVRRAIVGIPGFRYFRRRGEEQVDEEQSDQLSP
ncbi:hypothetical protein DFQ14_12235 [Halopolyspora algeriensis]|uniref:Ribulose 1,5-bisphosphate carboxylase large subunit n=1 Tax=Halopolyspora algeriensis TaxID=1500506 RepID=A0A368VE21_9ACTN|nr:hypothetical protein [Halopolyspora algeriensis]RCW38490.1 hypothetical protein DFQ14_12235 [Halopolyspora algeriensis]TQM42628.1 hypothetical protein FHU43_4265 [Halopolyspora algeriensis]